MEHGPAFEVWEGAWEGEDRLELVLARSVKTGWVLADLSRESAPSRFSRVPSAEDLASAAAMGRGFVVLGATDEIGVPEIEGWVASYLRVQAGSFADTDEVGLVRSWPWSVDTRDAGHGALDWRGVGANDLLALASGGASQDRRSTVDAAWVLAAGDPAHWSQLPDLFELQGLEDLPLYLSTVEEGVALGVSGPLTWTPADTRKLPSVAACERGLLTGESVASTGPLLTAVIGLPVQTPGGDWVQPIDLVLEANAEAEVDSVELWLGQVLHSEWLLEAGEARDWHRRDTVPLSGDVVAVARGEDWAVAPARFSADLN